MLNKVDHIVKCECGRGEFTVKLRSNKYIIKCAACGAILCTIPVYIVGEGNIIE